MLLDRSLDFVPHLIIFDMTNSVNEFANCSENNQVLVQF